MLSIKKIGLLLFIGLLSLSSCRTWFEVVTPESAYESREYTVAAELLTKEYEKEKNEVERAATAYKIGECYRQSNRTRQAEKWYKKALDYSLDPEVQYKYGLMLKTGEKYEAAIEQFKQYSNANPIERARAKRQIRSCQMALEWIKEPTHFRINNLAAVNSPAFDYSPVLMGDTRMVFTSDREAAKGEATYGWTGQNFSDIFMADRLGLSEFSNVRPFNEPINTPLNEGTLAFNATFEELFFSRCYSSEEDGDEYCHLFQSYLNSDGYWTEPLELFLFDEVNINVVQPALSLDGNQLYFAADAADGFGGKDLYVVERRADGWSYPKNLGPEINTIENEGYPFINHDGILYFASDGHPGMGGLDIFSATKQGKRWGKVQNLQYPINSASDDFGIVFQSSVPPALIDSIEALGFLASSRPRGLGNDDIYQFVLAIPQEEPEDTVPPVDSTDLLSAKVIWLDGIVLQEQFRVADDPNSEVIGKVAIPQAIVEVLGLDFDSDISARLITGGDGTFGMQIEAGQEISITASKNGFFTKSTILMTDAVKDTDPDTIRYQVEIILDQIFEEKEIVIDNIYYDFDDAKIREDAEPVLDIVAKLLRENPAIKVEFGSHTDSRGTGSYNRNLSQQRAESVVEYLVGKGIIASRLSAVGYGEAKLVNDCKDGVECSEDEHQQNRRTTFKVLAE